MEHIAVQGNLILVLAEHMQPGDDLYRILNNEMRYFGTIVGVQPQDGGCVQITFDDGKVITRRNFSTDWVERSNHNGRK